MVKLPVVMLLALLPAGVSQPGSIPVARYGSHQITPGLAVPLPDAQVTPGVADPVAVADVSKTPHMVDGVERNLSAEDFRTDPIRKSIKDFEKLKRDSCTEYSVNSCDAGVEGDHLISLENGGCKDCLENLWPEPVDADGVVGFHTKDVVENRTHDLICAGKITLEQGQRGLADDWNQFAKGNNILPTKN
jgi:hypothetical protein